MIAPALHPDSVVPKGPAACDSPLRYRSQSQATGRPLDPERGGEHADFATRLRRHRSSRAPPSWKSYVSPKVKGGTAMTRFLLLTSCITAFLPVSAMAAPPMTDEPAGAPAVAARVGGDDLPHPLGEKQRALKASALEARLNGKAYGRTHEVARGQFVELAREGQGMVWTVLGEFADLHHNSIA